MHLQRELLPIGGNILFLEVPLAISVQEKNQQILCSAKKERQDRTGNGLKPEVKYLALAGNLMETPIQIIIVMHHFTRGMETF